MKEADKHKTKLFQAAYPAFKSGVLSEAEWRRILDLLAARTSIKVLKRETAQIANSTKPR